MLLVLQTLKAAVRQSAADVTREAILVRDGRDSQAAVRWARAQVLKAFQTAAVARVRRYRHVRQEAVAKAAVAELLQQEEEGEAAAKRGKRKAKSKNKNKKKQEEVAADEVGRYVRRWGVARGEMLATCLLRVSSE